MRVPMHTMRWWRGHTALAITNPFSSSYMRGASATLALFFSVHLRTHAPAHARLPRFVSPARKLRLAVMEAAISTVATLLPAIEPVDYVTVTPSAKSPIGRTVLKVWLCVHQPCEQWHCRA